MILYSRPQFVPALKTIWKDCFGDGNEYVDFYFENRYRDENTLVCLWEGKPAAMLTLIPCTMTAHGTTWRGKYVYAVATTPRYQGRGLSGHLLEVMHTSLKNDGYDFSALVPASESLFDYYAKRGYKTQSYVLPLAYEKARYPWQLFSPVTFSPLSPQHFAQLRRIYGGDGLIQWEDDHLAYLIEETAFTGGESVAFTVRGKEGYAVCLPDGDYLIIKELGSPYEETSAVLQALMERYQKEQCIVRHRAAEDGRPFGMFAWYGDEPQGVTLYLSLVLD